MAVFCRSDMDPSKQRMALPHDSSGSSKARNRLVQSWMSKADVLRALSIGGPTLEKWRINRLILSVWDASSGQYFYPPFQFFEGRVIPAVASIMRWLEPYSNGSGWGEVEWWLSPHSLLDGKSPAEIIQLESARVLMIAEQEFSEDPAAFW